MSDNIGLLEEIKQLKEQIEFLRDVNDELHKLLKKGRKLKYQVNRLEIIDHTIASNNRCFVKHVDYDFIISPEMQDNGKTLKLFLSDIKQEA